MTEQDVRDLHEPFPWTPDGEEELRCDRPSCKVCPTAPAGPLALCDHCLELSGDHEVSGWPCATITALDGQPATGPRLG